MRCSSVFSFFWLKFGDRDGLLSQFQAPRRLAQHGVFEPVHVISLGKVSAVMGPSTLLPSEGSFDQRLRAVEHRSQLERFGEIGIERRPVIVDTRVRVS